MNTRSPSASLAAQARATRLGSLGAGNSPGHSTPRSALGSLPLPSRSSAVAVGDGSMKAGGVSATLVTFPWWHAGAAGDRECDVEDSTRPDLRGRAPAAEPWKTRRRAGPD